MAGFVRVHHLQFAGRMSIYAGILLTFGLLPLYYRFSLNAPPPLLFANLYVSYFLLILPMLWSILAWLAAGLPGFAELRRDRLRSVFALALLCLSLWGFASQGWAFQRINYPEIGETAALQLGITALFVVVLLCAAPPAQFVVGAVVIGLVWNSGITIAQALNQGWLGLWFLDELHFDASRPGVSLLQAGGLRFIRPYGLLPHPNMLAGMLLIGMLAAAAWLLSARRWLRWSGTLILPVSFYALLVTFSRGAWLGLAAGGLAVLPLLRVDFRRPAVRRHLALAALLLGLVGGIFFFQYAPFLASRAGANSESIELRSVSDRIVFIDFAQRSIAERPLLGVGIGNFPWRTSYYLVETFYDLRGDNVHHVMLSAWAELGIVGFVLVIAALIVGIETALQQIKCGCRHIDERAAKIGLFAGVMALIVVGLFDHYPWTILHFQAAWWGSLAVVMRDTAPSRAAFRDERQVDDDSRERKFADADASL